MGKTDLLTNAPSRMPRRARLGDTSSPSDAAPREPVGRARSKDSQPEIFADPLFRGLNPG